jgi:U3-containing 90S pre-ribosomal complex subunit
MGGDDLGSDDEYLNPSISDMDKSSLFEKLDKAEKTSSNKRRRDDSEEDESVDEVPTKKSSARVLIEAGRDLANESAEVQCAFLQTALTHEVQLRGNSVDTLLKLMPCHFSTSKESTLEARLRGAISMKKLKKYKTVKSPMFIVCMSARRAVAVLKELASLKVCAAKLFAKHMDVSQQRTMLTQHAYGLAVGTPNRLLALCQEDAPALNLNHTSLVILDSHASPKGYTVCTLPDTAGDCMELLRQKVLPQFKKRKDLQIAMF